MKIITFIFLTIALGTGLFIALRKSHVGNHSFSTTRFDSFANISPTTLEGITKNYVNLTGPVKVLKSTINDLTVTGNLHAEDSEIKTGTITGNAFLKNCTFNKNLTITGSLEAQASHFMLMNVTGVIKLTDCTIKNTLMIDGTLNATNSTLADIKISTEKPIILENSKADTIHVYMDNHYSTASSHAVTIHLSKNSLVNTISFETGIEGTIIKDATSSVDKVMNGVLKEK